jgi:hypothetical protein
MPYHAYPGRARSVYDRYPLEILLGRLFQSQLLFPNAVRGNLADEPPSLAYGQRQRERGNSSSDVGHQTSESEVEV